VITYILDLAFHPCSIARLSLQFARHRTVDTLLRWVFAYQPCLIYFIKYWEGLALLSYRELLYSKHNHKYKSSTRKPGTHKGLKIAHAKWRRCPLSNAGFGSIDLFPYDLVLLAESWLRLGARCGSLNIIELNETLVELQRYTSYELGRLTICTIMIIIMSAKPANYQTPSFFLFVHLPNGRSGIT